MFFIDEWNCFNLFVFIDRAQIDENMLFPGESYVLTVVNSIDTDRRMRLRLKSIREINSFIKKSPKNVKIFLQNLNDIEKLKAKLEDIKEGKNNVIIVYNGHEVDTGMKVDGN